MNTHTLRLNSSLLFIPSYHSLPSSCTSFDFILLLLHILILTFFSPPLHIISYHITHLISSLPLPSPPLLSPPLLSSTILSSTGRCSIHQLALPCHWDSLDGNERAWRFSLGAYCQVLETERTYVRCANRAIQENDTVRNINQSSFLSLSVFVNLSRFFLLFFNINCDVIIKDKNMSIRIAFWSCHTLFYIKLD